MKLAPSAYRTRRWSDISDGEVLEPQADTISYARVVMSAAATGAFFGGHIDPAYAQVQGRRNVYLATGPINGLIDRYVARWAGPSAFLRKRKVTMRESICAGDTITIQGRVARTWTEPARPGTGTGILAHLVELSLVTTNQLDATCVVAVVVLEFP